MTGAGAAYPITSTLAPTEKLRCRVDSRLSIAKSAIPPVDYSMVEVGAGKKA